MRFGVKGFVFLCFTSALAAAAEAETNWQSTTTDSWFNSSAWSSGLPSLTSSAVFNQTGGQTVYVADYSNGTTTFLGGQAFANVLDFEKGGWSLDLGTNVKGGNNGSIDVKTLNVFKGSSANIGTALSYDDKPSGMGTLFAGTMNVSGTLGTNGSVGFGTMNITGGTVDTSGSVSGGTINVSNGGDFELANLGTGPSELVGGLLVGAGSFAGIHGAVFGSISNSGFLGISGNVSGDLLETSTAKTELSAYQAVTVDNQLNLAGALDLDPVYPLPPPPFSGPPYTPQLTPGVYTLLIDPGSTITGRFSSLNVDGYASSDKDWQIVYTPHTVYAVLPPAPEPAAFAPFAAGLLGVGLFRRRRKV